MQKWGSQRKYSKGEGVLTVISFHGQIVPSQIVPISSQIVPQNSQFVPPKSQFVPHMKSQVNFSKFVVKFIEKKNVSFIQ